MSKKRSPENLDHLWNIYFHGPYTKSYDRDVILAMNDWAEERKAVKRKENMYKALYFLPVAALLLLWLI